MTITRALKPLFGGHISKSSQMRLRIMYALRWVTSTVLYTLVLGLSLGALVHIIAVFAIPLTGSNDAVNRLSEESMAAFLSDTIELGSTSFTPPMPDPSFITTACRFDLSGGPQRIRARVPDGFAGLSLHEPGGRVLYAVTDEVAQGGELLLTVLTPDQALEHKADNGDVRVIAPVQNGMRITYGLAVYRVMAARPSMLEGARSIASTLYCGS